MHNTYLLTKRSLSSHRYVFFLSHHNMIENLLV